MSGSQPGIRGAAGKEFGEHDVGQRPHTAVEQVAYKPAQVQKFHEIDRFPGCGGDGDMCPAQATAWWPRIQGSRQSCWQEGLRTPLGEPGHAARTVGQPKQRRTVADSGVHFRTSLEILEDRVGDVSRMPDDEAPDPATISTVEDLARSLRILQIHAGKPSVRDIERRTERAGERFPSSTIHDALRGNRGLPRREVVLAIVEALGCTEPAPWQSAWNRVALHRAGLPSVVTPSAVPLASSTRAGLDVNRITTVNEADAARLIEAGDVDEVAHVLAGLASDRAAARLNKTTPERVARVLATMDERAAANITAQMTPSVVAASFEAMPPTDAARVLARISFERKATILHVLKSTTAAAILQQVEEWPRFLGNVHNLQCSDIVRFLAAMPPGNIKEFFEHPDNSSKGAVIIAQVSAEDAALIIRQIPHDQAVKWLGMLQPKDFATAVADLQDDEIVAILQHSPPNVVRDRPSTFVQEFGEAKLVRLLAQLPAPALGEWLARLRGSLPNSSFSELATIMRQTAR